MSSASLADDWSLDLSQTLAADPARVLEWAAKSPRRSVSPDGARLVVARRRRGAPGTYATNAAPPPGTDGVESIDLVSRSSAFRVILPLGVIVDELRAHDDARVTIRFALDATFQDELDADAQIDVTAPYAALYALTEVPAGERGAMVLGAFAAFLAGVLPSVSSKLAARAIAFRESERSAAEERRRRDAEIVARGRREAHLKIRDLGFAVTSATVLGRIAADGELRWTIEVRAEGAGVDEVDSIWKPYLNTANGGLPHPKTAGRRVDRLLWQDQSAYDDATESWVGAFYIHAHESFDHCQIEIARAEAAWSIAWSGECDIHWNEAFRTGVPFALRASIDMLGIDVVADDERSATQRLDAHLDREAFRAEPLRVGGAFRYPLR